MSEPAWFTDAIAQKPESHHVTVDGWRGHYCLWGEPSKPGMVLIHGHAAHTHWWDFIAPSFLDHYQVAAVDLWGMGESDWLDEYSMDMQGALIGAVVDDAGFSDRAAPPVVIGHSFGGFCALQNACVRGDQLAGTIVIDSPVRPPHMEQGPPPRDLIIRQYQSVEQAVSRFRLMPPQKCENTYIVDYIAQNSVAELREGGVSWKFDPTIFARRERLWNPTDLLKNAKGPLVLMRGANSALVDEETSDYMVGVREHKTPMMTIPDAYHHVPLDQPLAMIEAIKSVTKDW